MKVSGRQFLNAREPWIPEIGYVLKVRPARLLELEEDLQVGSECSESVPEVSETLRRKNMLCLVSAKAGFITHIARAQVRYKASSGSHRLDVWNLLELSSPLSIAKLTKRLAGPQAWRAKNALQGGAVSKAAFQMIVQALRQMDSNVAKVLDELIDKAAAPAGLDEENVAAVNWAFQRDAAVTALEIAGIDQGDLYVPAQLPGDASADTVSIFDDVPDYIAIEDTLILNELDTVDHDWAVYKRHLYPAKTFRKKGTKLTVILANKLELERQLGVDLIYVNETLNAVVFVQYKMFRGEDGCEGYRPDAQLATEISRMDAAAAMLSKLGCQDGHENYRLNMDPFYLKFCQKLLTHDTNSHVPGYYVPLSYWKQLAASPITTGPKGGKVVFPNTWGKRYLTPSTFVALMERALIGTQALASEVLVPYLKAAMAGKSGLVLAVQSAEPDPPKVSVAPDDDVPDAHNFDDPTPLSMRIKGKRERIQL